MTTPLNAPVRAVTLLEDRANITRTASVALGAGRHRLTVSGVAPALQDVSLRATVDGAPANDVRVRRELITRQALRPEEYRALLEEVQALREKADHAGEQLARAIRRYRSVATMVAQGITELPQDVAWGLVNEDSWGETFGALFQRLRTLRTQAIEHDIAQVRALDDLQAADARRRPFFSRHHDLTAEVDIDLTLEEAGTVEISLTYTTPGALWRPMHAARLRADNTLVFSTFAAIWQHTGEDWDGVEVTCSTARSSLGTEPPLLHDDLLKAQRKATTVAVEAREVAVQTTGPSGAEAPPTAAVDLPGVDDGGEVRNIPAPHPASIGSDGQLHAVLLHRFETDASVEHVTYPELAEAVFLRSVQRSRGTYPILAGPVELIRDSGPVGDAEVLFVAPGATFELSFGPQDSLRLQRYTQHKEEVDETDKWTHHHHFVRVDLSNISGDAHTVRVVERIPVSEIAEIKVTLDEERTTPGVTVDDNGFCTWRISVEGRGHQSVRLHWRLSVAPGVDFSL